MRETAEAISGSKTITAPGHRLAIELLRLMPLYRDIGNLNAWEVALQDVFAEAEDQSEVGRLLSQVFAFGRYNMYAEFDVDGTEREFAAVRETLERSGVAATSASRIMSW